MPENTAIHILISEDRECDYIFTDGLLKKISAEFEVSWAQSFEKTLTMLHTNTFDICLLDYRLGIYTGFDVLGRVRQISLKTAFIIFTGISGSDIDNQAIQLGASDYLAKDDLNPELLERSIRYAIHRKKYEEKIARYVNEREILLKELEHRVKNNLQIVSGMLGLQNRATKNAEAKRIILKAQMRIRTMALIHEKLYQLSEAIGEIDFRDYTHDLMALLLDSHAQAATDVQVEIEMPHNRLDISKAVPLSLIISELVANAIAHAFHKGGPGKKISLRMRRYGEYLHFNFKDNGKGYRRSSKQETSFGLHLIDLLAKQLCGSLRFTGKKGLGVHIRFRG